jgi:hypothetical protein
MKNQTLLLIFCTWVSLTASAQQAFLGSNSVTIRIDTNMKVYRFTANDMSARLNEARDSFEFLIPISSFKSLQDSTDINFLESFSAGNDVIMITVSLPDDKDAQLDLSHFKGNRSVDLAAELKIGALTLEDDIDFNGLLMASNQRMAFDFQLFVNTRKMIMKKINDEQIIEIELGARGDKIIDLTSY